jgi:hypothetical protein
MKKHYYLIEGKVLSGNEKPIYDDEKNRYL